MRYKWEEPNPVFFSPKVNCRTCGKSIMFQSRKPVNLDYSAHRCKPKVRQLSVSEYLKLKEQGK